jgi:putative tryptophan/tyrosine transport system substrate-binding protein
MSGAEPGEAMKRREFITLLGGAATTWSARAQRPDRMRLIGVLMGYAESDPAAQSEVAAFLGALAQLGWTKGDNLRIEIRWSAGDGDRESAFAKELVGLRPDVILAQSTRVTDVVTRETRTIPIVFVNVADPITSGFAASLARPGGNVTGFANNNSALGGKWVQLLKELAPHTTHVGLLFNTATGAPLEFFMPSIQAAASSLGVEVRPAPVLGREEIENAIAAQARDPGGGLVVMPSAFSVANRDLIIALTARYGVPAIYFNRLFAESGGLIVYAADFIEQFRVAAEYVARIFRGANPGELPVQNPTKYELLINLKTAKALGLDVPLNLQQIADEVIE